MFKQSVVSIIKNLGYDLTPSNKYWFKGARLATTSYEIDSSFHELYEDGLKQTEMSNLENPLRRNRHYSLMKLLENADLNAGDVAECGCWKGMSTFQIATYLKRKNYTSNFYVFDSFEGLSDLDINDKVKDKSIDEEKLKKQFACSLKSVQGHLKDFPFIKYYKGWIPEKFHEVKDRTFSFVHIDVDLYQPIKDSIDFFYPRLCKNGIIVFDDYGSTQFPGAKKAIDEFVEQNESLFFIPMPSGEAFVINRNQMMNKEYLVTGAAGFIGSALARELLDKGNKIVTVDNLSTGFKENIPCGVEIIEGDCSDSNAIGKLDKYKFDTIFHIAGQSSGEISFSDPEYDLKTNGLSTLLLLQYALKTNCKKFIYASTMSVYGDQPDVPINEGATTLPKSFYAVSKLASENYMRIYSQYGINCTALRLFNVYGPGQNMKNLKQGMVSIFLAQALCNKNITVKGSPDRYRDFVYIDDVVDAFTLACKEQQSGYNYYNVGTGVRTTVKALLTKIKENFSFNIPIEFSGSTPGDQFGIYADCKKANNDIGWVYKTDLKDGLEEMIKWITKL